MPSFRSVIYLGTTFYEDQDTLKKKETIKKRDKAYEGSHLHFMKALSKKQLAENNYKIFDVSFEVPPYKYISVKSIANSKNVRITIAKLLSILYSVIQDNGNSFIIDQYGNYTPIENVLFGGNLGN